jgi:dephospho-CoA kinase
MKIGLSGGIGTGKSTVAKIFAAMNIPVYNADEKAKSFYANPKIAQEIAERFSLKLDKNKRINLKDLAAVAFSNKNNLQYLNNLIHPLVTADFEEWCMRQKSPYVLMESAIIYEANLSHLFDRIIIVAASEELVIKRIMERDAMKAEQIQQRKSMQWKQSEKISKADYIIENNAEKAVIPQIMKIHQDIIADIQSSQ